MDRFANQTFIRCKMREKVAYQTHFFAADALNLNSVKPYDDPSEKGYQRPFNPKRCNDFSLYLSQGDTALFIPSF
jgi:DNA sulfur modification protein DndB